MIEYEEEARYVVTGIKQIHAGIPQHPMKSKSVTGGHDRQWD
ncbi:hypothetical protein [Lacrimispora celerecrescens]|nr:hypothetical protein [Lacrimispora celerecrescens]